MTNNQQRIEVVRYLGWKSIPKDPEMVQYTAQMPNGKWGLIPDYPNNLNDIFAANKAIGLHDRENLAIRVKWVGHLRDIVARRCPVNKVGSPVVCDLDILSADAAELTEAFLLTVGKWKKK